MFETAETYYRHAPNLTPAERAPALYGSQSDAIAMVQAGRRPKSSAVAFARVNHSRWLVDCPDPTCGGCQYASKTDRRFFCHTCHNAAAGGGWVDVVWPRNAEVIERVLGERLDPRTRNWTPGETPESLRHENTLAGV